MNLHLSGYWPGLYPIELDSPFYLAVGDGIEPPTPRLTVKCSAKLNYPTAFWYSRRESNPSLVRCLKPMCLPVAPREHIGRPDRTRTYNFPVMSRFFFQLKYESTKNLVVGDAIKEEITSPDQRYKLMNELIKSLY